MSPGRNQVSATGKRSDSTVSIGDPLLERYRRTTSSPIVGPVGLLEEMSDCGPGVQDATLTM
jgi:hypothetical protein